MAAQLIVILGALFGFIVGYVIYNSIAHYREVARLNRNRWYLSLNSNIYQPYDWVD